jgi:hypothetical protein
VIGIIYNNKNALPSMTSYSAGVQYLGATSERIVVGMLAMIEIVPASSLVRRRKDRELETDALC